MQYVAFFGTGKCDPNKDLKQLLAILGFIAGWYIVLRIVRRVNASNHRNHVKITLKVIVVLLAIIGSIFLFLATWIGLACNG